MDMRSALPFASFIEMVCLPVPAPITRLTTMQIVILGNLGGDAVVWAAELELFILDQIRSRVSLPLLFWLHTQHHCTCRLDLEIIRQRLFAPLLHILNQHSIFLLASCVSCVVF